MIARGLVVLSLFVGACSRSGEPPSARSSAPVAVAAPVVSAALSATATATAQAPKGDEDDELGLTKAPASVVARSETVRHGGGITMGLPPGYRTAEGMCPGPSWLGNDGPDALAANCGCLFFWGNDPSRPGQRSCAIVRTKRPLPTGRAEGTLGQYGVLLGFDVGTWTDWTPTVVGPKRYPAYLSQNHGAKERGVALYIQIPDRNPLFWMGHWGNAQEQAAVLDIVRGITTCTYDAKKTRCTPDVGAP